jgi:aminocarboxymuconate-semialdehyde decarboxylase
MQAVRCLSWRGGWTTARVRKEGRHMPRPPSDYLRRFTYDTISHSPEILRWLIAQVGVDRIVLGSDYTFDMGYDRPRPRRPCDDRGVHAGSYPSACGGRSGRPVARARGLFAADGPSPWFCW